MTGGPKIIGMRRERREELLLQEEDIDHSTEEDTKDEKTEESGFLAENEAVDATSDDDAWTYYGDEEVPERSFRPYFVPVGLGLLGAAWTGFFLWANRDIFTTMPTAQEGAGLITQWCLPIAVLAVLYLIFMRNSTKEANRFADASSSLRAESEMLEARLKTVNNELSIAREFLSQETKELEFLGDQSSRKLNSAAGLIKTSLSEGLASMRELDEVGGAAYKNLDQLREHLPVVINTAKDVTNQIGNSGRAAQTEMAAMVATLKRVGEVGTAAKQSLDTLTETSAQSLDNLEKTTDEVKTRFEQQLSEAEAGSNKIAGILKTTAAETLEALNKTRAELATETSESSQAIRSELDALEASISSVGTTADDEEKRLNALVSELNESVREISTKVEDLDNESGEKTAKLAFAMTALEENSNALQQSLESGHGTADGLIERVENLLAALDSSARELDETLPSAFARVSEQSEQSLSAYNRISEEARKAADAAEQVTSSIDKSDAQIEQQQNKLRKLQEDGASMADGILEKIEAISGSLEEVREQNESLAESAGEKLINALLRVRETAKQASEHSRETLENAITGSMESFEKVSEEALNRVIDEKIASIAPNLESAVSSAVSTTEATANHLTEQLTAIEEMTTSLEQRILFAKEKAEQSSDENFTRRVALLTESLNSTAIDVTKLLSNEVTDTEWAAYLKGDRGIFTRRAVRLLDSGEVREILLEYENNSEFREHVNRYIHDFEAMLRGVLATRDGSAISVTLLSSDIGKLYVALAQAIERLRG